MSTQEHSVEQVSDLYDDATFGTYRPQNSREAADVKQCAACHHYFPEAYGFDTDDLSESYTVCTERCYWRAKASDLINGVVYDHRFCGACFERLKEVEPPGRRADSAEVMGDAETYREFRSPVPDFAIGEAFREPHTIDGLTDSRGLAETASGVWDIQHKDLVTFTWACSCGTCDHTDVWRISDDHSKKEARRLGTRLLTALNDRRERSKHDEEYSESAFYDRLNWIKSQDALQGMDVGEVLERSLANALCLAVEGYQLPKPDP